MFQADLEYEKANSQRLTQEIRRYQTSAMDTTVIQPKTQPKKNAEVSTPACHTSETSVGSPVWSSGSGAIKEIRLHNAEMRVKTLEKENSKLKEHEEFYINKAREWKSRALKYEKTMEHHGVAVPGKENRREIVTSANADNTGIENPDPVIPASDPEILLHYTKELRDLIAKKILKMTVPDGLTRADVWHCVECGKKFKSKEDASIHVKTYHYEMEQEFEGDINSTMSELAISESVGAKSHDINIKINIKSGVSKLAESGSVDRLDDKVELIRLKFKEIDAKIALKIIKITVPGARCRSKCVWKCSDCDEEFTSKGEAYRHAEARHINHPGFSCFVCGVISKSREGLRKHLERVHSLNLKNIVY